MENEHISSKFDEDLNELKNSILRMGGEVEQQVGDAINAFVHGDSDKAQNVRDRDREVDAMELQIDEDCVMLIAKRQPTAVDLRTVMAIAKIVSDLERIGDEAKKIAKIALLMMEEGQAPIGYVEVRHIGDHVLKMVHEALDCFARLDAEHSVKVMKEDKAVDEEYKSATRSLMTFMMEDPRSISLVLSIMWSLRALERVGDHARNIAEQVIFMVKGTDVRHTPIEQVQQVVEQETD